MAVILHLMGPTCAGKSTLIAEALKLDPVRVGAVEVGKMLRAKYGPAHFKGQAAPQHTQDEAWSMYVDGVERAIGQGKTLVLIDGQPRDIKQAQMIEGLWKHPRRAEFAMIHAEHAAREARARVGREGDDLELAMQRLNNDYRNCYVVMVELLRRSEPIHIIDTSLEDAAGMRLFAQDLIDEYA